MRKLLNVLLSQSIHFLYCLILNLLLEPAVLSLQVRRDRTAAFGFFRFPLKGWVIKVMVGILWLLMKLMRLIINVLNISLTKHATLAFSVQTDFKEIIFSSYNVIIQ